MICVNPEKIPCSSVFTWRFIAILEECNFLLCFFNTLVCIKLQSGSKEMKDTAMEVGVVHYQVLARLHDVDKTLDKKG